MSEPTTPTPSQPDVSAPLLPPDGVWGEFVSLWTPQQIAEAARTLSRRGKLPGYEPGTDGAAFAFTAFGAPMDYRVVAVARAEGAGTRVTFHAKMRPKLPVAFGVVTALSIWPGAPITDSLIRSYFLSYDYPQWVTWAWYLPLTVVPLPFMLVRMLRNSRAAAFEHCTETIDILRAACGPGEPGRS